MAAMEIGLKHSSLCLFTTPSSSPGSALFDPLEKPVCKHGHFPNKPNGAFPTWSGKPSLTALSVHATKTQSKLGFSHRQIEENLGCVAVFSVMWDLAMTA